MRQSIAARYGEREYSDGRVWDQLFDAAEKAELGQLGAREASGFLPNWGLAGSHSAYPVERYAYLYPLSRDVGLYHRLVEQVSRYRAVLGQPDQEELLRLLGSKVDAGTLAEEDLRELFVNLCPFVWQRDAGGEGQPCVSHFTSGQYCRAMRQCRDTTATSCRIDVVAGVAHDVPAGIVETHVEPPAVAQ